MLGYSNRTSGNEGYGNNGYGYDGSGYKESAELNGMRWPTDPSMASWGSGSDDSGADDDRDSGLATAINRPKVTQPPLYKVVLFNDDYTPMDFVVEVLCSFFSLNVEKATQIMLKVHTEGKAVCGVFSKDVAETKTQQVNDYSRECEQPLLCNVEVDR